MTDAQDLGSGSEPIGSVTVHMKARWASMMAAKVLGAFRPLQLLLFAFACSAIGIVVAVDTETSFLVGCGGVLAAVTALRLVIMAVSSAVDTNASKRFDGAFTFSDADIAQVRSDGTRASHEWAWVLDAKERGETLVLRVDERRGNSLFFLSHAGLGTQLARMRALLSAKGKLR